MQIILLNGSHGIGKTTIADQFVEKYGFAKLELGKLPKQILCKTLGLNIEEFEKLKKSDNIFLNNKTIRQILIDFAEESKRLHGKYFWVDALFNNRPIKSNDKIIIPDFYYKEEYEYIKNNYSNVLTVKLDNETVYNLKNFKFDLIMYYNYSDATSLERLYKNITLTIGKIHAN